jgi:hypothetical protein
MLGKFWIGPLFIARIAVHVRGSFRCNRSQLDRYRMAGSFKVAKSMGRAPDTAELGTPTAKIPALKAKPKIFFEVT